MKKINQWICKHFGHYPDPIDLIVEAIKQGAITRHEPKRVKCRRCKDLI